MASPSFLILLVIVGSVSCGRLPGFSWDGSRTSNYGVPHLIINFPDGSSDVALLERYNPIPVSETEREMDVDACIFRGKLLHNTQVPIAVTGGCPFSDSFEISIFSDKLSHNIYKVENGVVSGLELPWAEGTKSSTGSIQDISLEAPEKKTEQRVSGIDRALPTNGLVAKIKLFSDATFRSRFGAESVNTMRRVMVHTQNFFNLGDSLKTTITLDITGTAEITESITANGNDLGMVAKYATDAGIHFNVHMCSENNAGGVVGIAWLGTCCSSSIGYRSSVNEYFYTDSQTGGIVAHEMGHNLGMSHDFTSSGGPRSDSNGQTCTGVGGIMDYATPVKWSTCSVQDFTNYYNQFSQFCIPTNSNPTTAGPTVSTTTTTTTTTTTKASCIQSWISDTWCDDENNNAQCNYDGGDCCNNPKTDYKKYCTVCACLNPGVTPSTTTTTTTKASCIQSWIADTWCDDENNNAQCNYDGGDCCNNPKADYKKYCSVCACLNPGVTTTTTTTTTTSSCVQSWISDTWCDDVNNNAQCNYDGGDCCNNPKEDYKKYCSVCACLP